MAELNETEKEIVDDYGLHITEKCSYIQVNTTDILKVEKFLAKNDIPSKTFESACEAFSESLAESEIRGMVENEEDAPEEAEFFAIINRERVGKVLYESIDACLDGGNISEIAHEAYYQDIVERVDVPSASALELGYNNYRKTIVTRIKKAAGFNT